MRSRVAASMPAFNTTSSNITFSIHGKASGTRNFTSPAAVAAATYRQYGRTKARKRRSEARRQAALRDGPAHEHVRVEIEHQHRMLLLRLGHGGGERRHQEAHVL